MLIMISNGYRRDNQEIYKLMDQSKKIVYIPSWSGEGALKDFKKFKKQHKNAKVTYFPISQKPVASKLKALKQCDLIYFDGGNTFFLLDQLKKLNLFDLIKKLSKEKVVVGMSAGAIIQTPNINMARIPHFNADENDVNLKKFSSLKRVGFEVYPHFEIRNKKELKELMKYSRTHKRKIYLIPDGSAIIKDKKSLRAVGKTYLLHRGRLCAKSL